MSEGVWSSYSGVSKYYPVLQDCKIWASSDQWWWRYSRLHFCWFAQNYQSTAQSVHCRCRSGMSEFTKNKIWCISITSGRMKLILCSFVVLVSTSKPQSMSSKLLLVSELHYDFDLFAEILHTPSLSLRSYASRNSVEPPTLAELIIKIMTWNLFGFFSAIGPMCILYVKNTSNPFWGL